jgi:tRNA modification GTPase
MSSPEPLSATPNLTAALLTPSGRGAVAVIRVHTAKPVHTDQSAKVVDASFVSVSGRSLSEQPVGRLCYGHWTGDSTSEDVVVCRTDESTVEVSCHGGRAAVNRILDSLKAEGVLIVDWQTQQATISSPFDRELAEATSQATTTRTAAMLLEQATGRLKDALTHLLELDLAEITPRLAELLTFSQLGLHLTQPWKIVIAGRPNVGKSTLINALLGFERAIVFDQPGTTRDVVTGMTAFDGWPFQLADTAGIRNTDDELEQAGIQRARRTVESADLVCLLLDTSCPPTAEDEELLAEFNGSKTDDVPPTIIVAHKADLPDQWAESNLDEAVRVSSATGHGVEKLISTIVETLIPKIPPTSTNIPVSHRQIQWLDKAWQAAKADDVALAKVAITNCLSGAVFVDEAAVARHGSHI